MQNPHAVCVVATQDGKPGVVGGTWGYALRPSRVQRTTGHEKIAEFLNRRYPEEGHVAYQDEIFVLERLWSNGIGKRLFRARYRKLAMAGLKVFVARTKRASPAYRWYLGMNYSVACEYEDGRVIMVAHRDDMPFVDLTDEADPDQ